MIEFVDKVPPIQGHVHYDRDRLDELLDALLAAPNEWAKIPITFVAPDIEGASDKRLIAKARNFASDINSKRVSALAEYPCEAKSRRADVYIRMALSHRQIKEMGLDQ